MIAVCHNLAHFQSIGGEKPPTPPFKPTIPTFDPGKIRVFLPDLFPSRKSAITNSRVLYLGLRTPGLYTLVGKKVL